MKLRRFRTITIIILNVLHVSKLKSVAKYIAKLCQPIFETQIALYSPCRLSVGWLSRFVTINSTSIEPSMKVRNLTSMHHIIPRASSVHHQCIISASSLHHQCIIGALSGHHQGIIHQGTISPSSVHHQCIISASSVHYQRINSASSAHHQRMINASSMHHQCINRA